MRKIGICRLAALGIIACNLQARGAGIVPLESCDSAQWTGPSKPERGEYKPLCGEARAAIRFVAPKNEAAEWSKSARADLSEAEQIALRLVSSTPVKGTFCVRSGGGSTTATSRWGVASRYSSSR